MKEVPIILNWTKDGKQQTKEIDRKNFFDIMNSVRKGFEGDNQISNLLCTRIPEITAISINQDRNSQMDVPFIQIEIDGKIEVIDIIRYLKIIWAILDGYCK